MWYCGRNYIVTIFNLLGDDKTISFCYRQENALDDATIALTLQQQSKKVNQ